MRILLAAFLCVALACTSSSTATNTPPPAAKPVVAEVVDAGAPQPAPPIAEEDPWMWLEEIESEKSLAWVKERNAVSQKELEADPNYAPLNTRLKSIYDSKERIPGVTVLAGALYNFWKDEAHPRGLWRRTTLAEFKKPGSAAGAAGPKPSPKWEDVLDLDALGAAEKQSYVWKGATCFPPKYERCLVAISVGGSDAKEVREFDLVKKQFVVGGFMLPAAKSTFAWKNLDTLLVGTDFGPGTLTTSGYARQIKEWKRGTRLADAKVIAEGETTDVAMAVAHEFDHGKTRDWIYRSKTFFSDETWLLENEKLIKIDKPDDATVSAWNDQALIQLRSDWVINENIYKAGSLLSTSMASLKAGKRDFTVLFAPTPNTSLDGFAGTR
ncbi:MAG: S9 family peptidase, partial [Archangium sp.]|nr:S9 family peptidase [Archangium sp.]